jgi:hypothetical protein
VARTIFVRRFMTLSCSTADCFLPAMVMDVAEPPLTDSARGQAFRAIMTSAAHPGGRGG